MQLIIATYSRKSEIAH